MSAPSERPLAGLHADAVHILGEFAVDDPRQRELRDQYLDFLHAHPDALDRSCRTGHLTASALVLNASGTEVLLTLHPIVGRWLQLGGHCEPGDATIRAAAFRETIEESGIDAVEISDQPIQLDRHPVRCAGGMSEHLDVQYLAVVPDSSLPIISEESDDLRWFPVDAVPPDVDASVRSLLAAARSRASRR